MLPHRKYSYNTRLQKSYTKLWLVFIYIYNSINKEPSLFRLLLRNSGRSGIDVSWPPKWKHSKDGETKMLISVSIQNTNSNILLYSIKWANSQNKHGVTLYDMEYTKWISRQNFTFSQLHFRLIIQISFSEQQNGEGYEGW